MLGVGVFFAGITAPAFGAATHTIVIDGNFSDWSAVPSHYDPVGGPGVLHDQLCAERHAQDEQCHQQVGLEIGVRGFAVRAFSGLHERYDFRVTTLELRLG